MNSKIEHDYDINFLLIHTNQKLNDLYVGKIIFRGDARAAADIFTQGFNAKGTNLDFTNHISPVATAQSDSGYISTSKSQMVAKRFPMTFDDTKLQEKTYLYEIAMPKEGIDITLLPECQFLNEQEVVVPHKIESSRIRGVWEVDCNWSEGFFSNRQINPKSYKANPDFNPSDKASKNVLAAEKITTVGRSMGHFFTGIGVTIDSIRLAQSFKISMEQNNFSPFFYESARIICGWQGAMVMGTLGAKAGAALGVFAGPAGVAVGSLVGGFIGSGVGYWAGSEAMKQAVDLNLQPGHSSNENNHFLLSTKNTSKTPTMNQSLPAPSWRPLKLSEVRQFDCCTLTNSPESIDKRLNNLQQSQRNARFFKARKSNHQTIDNQLATIAQRQAVDRSLIPDDAGSGCRMGSSSAAMGHSNGNSNSLPGFFSCANNNHGDNGSSYADSGSSHKGGGWCDYSASEACSSSGDSDLSGWRVDISFDDGHTWSDGRSVLGLK